SWAVCTAGRMERGGGGGAGRGMLPVGPRRSPAESLFPNPPEFNVKWTLMGRGILLRIYSSDFSYPLIRWMMLRPARWSFTVSLNAASTIARAPARSCNNTNSLAAESGLDSSIQDLMSNGWLGFDFVFFFGLGFFMGHHMPPTEARWT